MNLDNVSGTWKRQNELLSYSCLGRHCRLYKTHHDNSGQILQSSSNVKVPGHCLTGSTLPSAFCISSFIVSQFYQESSMKQMAQSKGLS